MESVSSKLGEYKIPILLSLVGAVLIIGGIFSSNLLSPKVSTTKSSALDSKYKASLVSASSNPSQIKVDISGAVLLPGVKSLAANSRVEDLIKEAGGFNASASAEYISKSLNLSQKVSDGQKFYIPFQGEAFSQSLTSQGQVAGVSTAKIGINSATQAQLESLPGVGPATAQKIISKRPYQDLSDLTAKKAVSKSVFDKIKDLIDLN